MSRKVVIRNENTVDEKYSSPTFEDILDGLSGATIFSSLDLQAGYHQVRMHPRDKHKTTFTFVIMNLPECLSG